MADEPVGPPEPVPTRMQANPLTANTAPTFVHPTGKVTTDFGGEERVKALVIQPDGRLIVAGDSTSTNPSFRSSFALARYLADGNLDTSFGSEGKVTTNLGGYDYPGSVLNITKSYVNQWHTIKIDSPRMNLILVSTC